MPLNASCEEVALERADDAVMAFYTVADSSDQHRIYDLTYRDCLKWHRKR